ncbi:hypothetical protein A3K69_05695 [Candidatus Bathyarchaeota archaeon RBG_16_57_9]|nr:MAG: hypothetical protein A3K69_05695 [Candidatus Bathyarchaeota archaeon RBG_16_57_9]OGD54396.1 MAG: hypothetical protein A3K81_06900 [Candidatus Bathyarchaeota archaeon RBG_13_60_20]
MSVRAGRVINYSSRDPHLNLALEEALLRLHGQSHHHATVRFWRNPRAVVLGRGQRAEEEVNLEYCGERGITVCRRMSGGGTVYHDEGNLNVSLLVPRSALPPEAGIKAVCASICGAFAESIRECGVDGVECLDTNITHMGRKVSGSAAYFTRDSLLYHSTLLHSANLEDLERSLRQQPSPHRLSSAYMPTSNLGGLDLDRWRETLIKVLGRRYETVFREAGPSHDELRLAHELRESKYSTPAWILG